MTEILANVFVVAGALVVLAGGAGLLRFPDFFCRLHSAGIVDTLGTWLITAGLLLLSDSVITGFKVILIALLFLLLSPVVSHALSCAALSCKVQNLDGNEHQIKVKEKA